MCWAEKFCLVIPLNLGAVLLGVINIIASTTMIITSAIHFLSESHDVGILTKPETPNTHLQSAFKLYLSEASLNILLGVVLVTGVLWMMMSFLLILGICRNSSGCVLAYFFFGIILIIVAQLGALLVLLKSCWALAFFLFFVSLLYIHFQVALYTVYELMVRGQNFSFHKLDDEDEAILEIESSA